MDEQHLAKTLVLVPTKLELDMLRRDERIENLRNAGLQFALCGFGIVAAGILSTRLIQEFKPNRLLLAGIAGTFRSQLSPGTALEFSSVSLTGVGVGNGAGFQSIEEMGYDPFQGILKLPAVLSLGWNSEEKMPVSSPASLLTVSAASANVFDRDHRLIVFPDAVAEDMEGYAVAVAALAAAVPLRIIRGISNAVGDRNHREWKIREAIQATVPLICRCFDSRQH